MRALRPRTGRGAGARGGLSGAVPPDSGVTNPVTQILFPALVVVVMFALGTGLTTEDLRRVLSRPKALIVGSAAHAVGLPVLAFALALLFRPRPELAIGLVIIASCPANSTSNLFTHLAGGDTMLSVCLTAATSLLATLSIPYVVNLALAAFRPEGGAAVALPVVGSALAIFLLTTLPVIAGMALRRARPALAKEIEARMGAFGLIVIAVVVALAVWSEKDNVLPSLWAAGGLAIGLNVLAVAAAWGMSALFGLPTGQRIAIGLECGLQNFAMAAFISMSLLGDIRLLAPAIAYGLTMWISAGVVVFLSRRARPRTAGVR